jgi:hypothetical protein
MISYCRIKLIEKMDWWLRERERERGLSVIAYLVIVSSHVDELTVRHHGLSARL